MMRLKLLTIIIMRSYQKEKKKYKMHLQRKKEKKEKMKILIENNIKKILYYQKEISYLNKPLLYHLMLKLDIILDKLV